jgi:hypothetical protein
MENYNSQPDIGKKNYNRLLIFVAGLGTAFFPPVTKGKTLKGIEIHFEGDAGLPGHADASKGNGQNN